MKVAVRFLSCLRAMLRRWRMERDMEAEVRFHIEDAFSPTSAGLTGNSTSNGQDVDPAKLRYNRSASISNSGSTEVCG